MTTQNRIKTVLTLAVVVTAMLGLAAAPASAAELIHVETVEVWHQDVGGEFNVSVYPGKASYSGQASAGAVSGIFGDGTVADYRFFDNSGTTFNDAGYADGGAGIVGEATATNSSGLQGGPLNWADVWTTNDPDTEAANFTQGTIARSQGVLGTIDISGISRGTLYFIYGSYINPNTVSLTMSGPGQPDLTAEHTEDPPARNIVWISSFDFSDAGAYDTITYTYTNTDTDGSRARFMGVIVYAADPMNPSPADGAVIAPGDVELSWTNLPSIIDPNNGTVWVDVWFGTDPNVPAEFTQVVTAGVDGENRTSVTVSAPLLDPLTPTRYYWQVNSYLNGLGNDPNTGHLYTFYVADLPPSSVDAGIDMITWSGEPVQLDGTVVDDGLSGLIYAWSANAPDGIAVDFSATDVEDPTVTITRVPYSSARIVNPGFEDPVLAEGDWTWLDVPGWTQVGPESIGVWNPETVYFPAEAPEGQNVAYIWHDPVPAGGLTQVLAETLAADTTYTLTMQVGNSATYDSHPGYQVQLLAGGTVLAEDNNTLTIPEGQFVTSTVTYTYDPAHSDLVGEPLEIRLLHKALGDGGTELEFDDVQLVADPPFPAPAGMVSVELTLAVSDEANPMFLTDTMTIDVYDDACQMAVALDPAVIEPTDFNGDCVTNLVDFAELASKWLDNYELTEPLIKQ